MFGLLFFDFCRDIYRVLVVIDIGLLSNRNLIIETRMFHLSLNVGNRY